MKARACLRQLKIRAPVSPPKSSLSSFKSCHRANAAKARSGLDSIFVELLLSTGAARSAKRPVLAEAHASGFDCRRPRKREWRQRLLSRLQALTHRVERVSSRTSERSQPS